MRHAVCLLSLAAAMLVSPSLAYPAEQTSVADIEIHFVPQAEFAVYVPSVAPGNVGYFAAYWNGNGEITRAVALIATDSSQAERVHTIREEITQALGPMKDSYRYPDSIFYQPWSTVDRFADMDKALIRSLYRQEVRPNMTKAQVRDALRGLCTPEQIDYLVEIVCGAEYAQSDEMVHKWLHSPTLRISGEVSEVDVRTVNQVVRDLNSLIGKIQLKVTDWSIQPRKPVGTSNTTVATARPKAKSAKKDQPPRDRNSRTTG